MYIEIVLLDNYACLRHMRPDYALFILFTIRVSPDWIRKSMATGLRSMGTLSREAILSFSLLLPI